MLLFNLTYTKKPVCLGEIDHLICWRTIDANALEAFAKVVI